MKYEGNSTSTGVSLNNQIQSSTRLKADGKADKVLTEKQPASIHFYDTSLLLRMQQ